MKRVLGRSRLTFGCHRATNQEREREREREREVQTQININKIEIKKIVCMHEKCMSM